MIEDCPQLLAKIQERRTQMVQPNVQKISIERRTQDPRIPVVTKGGAATGDDQMNVVVPPEGPWVKKAVKMSPDFDPL